MNELQEISEATAFDQGDLFASEDEVRVYFRPESQEFMFGDDAEKDPVRLREWAEAVIDNGWHMTKGVKQHA